MLEKKKNINLKISNKVQSLLNNNNNIEKENLLKINKSKTKQQLKNEEINKKKDLLDINNEQQLLKQKSLSAAIDYLHKQQNKPYGQKDTNALLNGLLGLTSTAKLAIDIADPTPISGIVDTYQEWSNGEATAGDISAPLTLIPGFKKVKGMQLSKQMIKANKFLKLNDVGYNLLDNYQGLGQQIEEQNNQLQNQENETINNINEMYKPKKLAFGTGLNTGVVPFDIATDLLTGITSQQVMELMNNSGGDTINPTKFKKEFGLGGNVTSKVPVEVEDKEVVESPGGELGEFKGATHEQGGINTSLEEGTKVYSNRLKIDNKTFADRKKSREKKLALLMSKLDVNKDSITKNSLDRFKMVYDKQEQMDLSIQEAMNQLQKPKQKLAFGTPNTGINNYAIDFISNFLPKSTTPIDNNVEDLFDNEEQQRILAKPLPTPTKKDEFTTAQRLSHVENFMKEPLQNRDADITTNLINSARLKYNESKVQPVSKNADNLGLMSDMLGTISPLLMTMYNKSQTKPNVSMFDNYGDAALNTNEQAMSLISSMKDNKLQDANLDATTTRKGIANNSRSVNTSRAMNVIADEQNTKNKNNIQDSYTQQLMYLLANKGNIQLYKDQVVMQGKQQADLANRQDKDAYNTNLNKDLIGLAEGMQRQSAYKNKKKYNDDLLKLLPLLSEHSLGFDKNMNMISLNK